MAGDMWLANWRVPTCGKAGTREGCDEVLRAPMRDMYEIPAAWLNQCRLSIAFVICSDATKVILSGLFANLRVPCLIEGRCHMYIHTLDTHTLAKPHRFTPQKSAVELPPVAKTVAFLIVNCARVLCISTHNLSVSQSVSRLFARSFIHSFTHSVSQPVRRAIHLHALFFVIYSRSVCFNKLVWHLVAVKWIA